MIREDIAHSGHNTIDWTIAPKIYKSFYFVKKEDELLYKMREKEEDSVGNRVT